MDENLKSCFFISANGTEIDNSILKKGKSVVKQCILVSGPTIANDRILVRDLEKFSNVVRNPDNSQIQALVVNRKFDLILVEILQDNSSEVEIIKKVKSRFPNIEIILIDGNGDKDVIAKAFAYGAKDAFRKPYKVELIVERSTALAKAEVQGSQGT